MNRFISRGLLVFAACFCWGCRQANEPAVAKVGGAPITVSELQTRLTETPAAYQQYMASPEGRRQFLNLMIREKLLLTEARRSGLQDADTYKTAIQKFKEKWKRELADYQESLLIEMYLNRLRSHELSVPDAEVQQYYQAHAAEFAKPVEIRASHILLKSEADANQALARLKAGEPFAKVAQSVSMDPATARQGGKLTPFQRGTLLPEFEAAVAQLKNGQTSGIVKSQFGYHIIRKIGQKNLPPVSYEQAKETIRARLQREKFDQWVARTQAAVGVQIDDQALASLAAPAPAGAAAASPAQELSK